MKWTPATVEKKHVWAPGLFTLTVRCPEVQAFEPGQFLQLAMEVDGTHVHRPYSVASPPGESVDFFIVVVEDGKLTPHLWKLEEGDAVQVSQRAAGGFTLKHSPSARVLWLLATGTGIAPYIAMLRTNTPWESYKKIVFVHGVRHGSDLAYQDELAVHSSKYGDRFKYIPVVSRAEVPGALPGRITNCIQKGSLQQMAGEEFGTDSCVLMCGNPDMLNETEELLIARGLKKHKAKDPGQIVVERYW